MRKSDYLLLARIIRERRAAIQRVQETSFTRGMLAGTDLVIERFARECRTINRDEFMRACGIE